MLDNVKSLLFQSMPIVYDLYYIFMMYYFGIIRGFIYITLIYESVIFILEKILRLDRLSELDKIFINLDKTSKFKLCLLLKFDKMDPIKMKEYLVQNTLKRFKKFRCKVIKKFGLYFWEERPLEEATKRLHVVTDESLIMNNDNDIKDYVTSIFDSNKEEIVNNYPYDIYVVQNLKSKEGYQNFIFIATDHVIGDGMGASLVSSGSASNYSHLMYPLSVSKTLPLYYKIMLYLLCPFNTIIIAINYVFKLKRLNSPIGVQFKNIKKTGDVVISLSDKINFNKMRDINKKLGVSFNTLMASIINSSIKKVFKEDFNYDCPYINIYSMVGLKPIPKNRDKIILANANSGYGVTIYNSYDDPIKNLFNIQNQYAKYLSNMPLLFCHDLIQKAIANFFPIYLSKIIFYNTYDFFDFTFSNVPGSKQVLEYGDWKVIDMYPIVNSGFKSVFFVLFSYNGFFRIECSIDKAFNYKPDRFIREIENSCNNVLISELNNI